MKTSMSLSDLKNFYLANRSASNWTGRLMKASSFGEIQIGFDHFSNWDGFWMDLNSSKKREIEGRFMNEQFTFTGRGGEFFRCWL